VGLAVFGRRGKNLTLTGIRSLGRSDRHTVVINGGVATE